MISNIKLVATQTDFQPATNLRLEMWLLRDELRHQHVCKF